MPRPILLCLLSVSMVTADSSLVSSLFNRVVKEVVAVADPFAKTIAAVGSHHCSELKNILRYEEEEPDLSGLTLNFITSTRNYTYLLSEAAELIPRSDWFNYSRPLKIYFHGFIDDPSQMSYANINSAFLSQGDYNILALDASSTFRYLYVRSTTMARFIGAELGAVLVSLVNGGLNPSSIHLIGHSLGSHISGFAGKTFFSKTGLKIGRITGLDPAGPCFINVNRSMRLSEDDAEFVDVIHTDAGVYGLNLKIGHVDFYPNSGSQQPSCMSRMCSHSRAWEMFAESVVNPQTFISVSCDNWQQFRDDECDRSNTSVMGLACPKGTTGSYYLQTAGEAPYGLGPEGLTFKNNEGLVRTIGAIFRVLER